MSNRISISQNTLERSQRDHDVVEKISSFHSLKQLFKTTGVPFEQDAPLACQRIT